ncbi:hypothetical protein CLV63_10222 [Murinocardiopsis flavida]|uniref:Uncharacterized protein n=1 Tax=Murinocardiopsis flavida TaxID=645275 RepID=A0A2P8DRQ4_9ACTN|nr:hypothetical protein [Murinocardiopsis flavida]PSK99895.1 hypothetical protein CLV63_10222 [Murinocardiopsis flavida]
MNEAQTSVGLSAPPLVVRGKTDTNVDPAAREPSGRTMAFARWVAAPQPGS